MSKLAKPITFPNSERKFKDVFRFNFHLRDFLKGDSGCTKTRAIYFCILCRDIYFRCYLWKSIAGWNCNGFIFTGYRE